MDLRPKIAAEIVEALLDEMGCPEADRVRVRDHWVTIAKSKLVSHSLPTRDYSTHDPDLVEKYLVKYPEIRPAIESCLAYVRNVIPEGRARLELTSDPEMCHICFEGQSLRLIVGVPPEKWRDTDEMLRDWWIEYSGQYRDIPAVFLLFSPYCECYRESE